MEQCRCVGTVCAAVVGDYTGVQGGFAHNDSMSHFKFWDSVLFLVLDWSITCVRVCMRVNDGPKEHDL